MSRPNVHSHPDGWERSWQALLDRVLLTPSSQIKQSRLLGDEKIGRRMMSEEGYSTLALEHKRLIQLQDDIQEKLAQKCAEDDFMTKWKDASADVRKSHYFTAMQRVCEIPDMEQQRNFCPEISLKAFESAGSRQNDAEPGQGYLNILLHIARERSAGEYNYLQHPLVDAMYDLPIPWIPSETYTPDPKLYMQRWAVLRRTLFISLVVFNVLLSFYGLSENYFSDKADRQQPIPRDIAATFKEEVGSKEFKRLQEETRQLRHEQGHAVCTFCEKPDFLVPEAGPFKLCAKCKGIGRTVRYCSRECQVAHWKQGNPPHKVTCGKPASEHPVQTAHAQPEGDDIIPPADPSFIRSPALVHQTKLLSENPTVDYVFVRPYPEPDQGMMLADTMGKLFFRISRERAFTSGDAQAVRSMWSMLLDKAQSVPGYGKEGLRSQMRREYGFDPETGS